MDTDKEKGSVENVDVLYKNEYTLKSDYMDFDFKNGITITNAPVNITREQTDHERYRTHGQYESRTIRNMEHDVSGVMETGKQDIISKPIH